MSDENSAFNRSSKRPSTAPKCLGSTERRSGKRPTADQIQSVDYIVDDLTEQEYMNPELRYESLFTDRHPNGVVGVFAAAEVELAALLHNFRTTAAAALAQTSRTRQFCKGLLQKAAQSNLQLIEIIGLDAIPQIPGIVAILRHATNWHNVLII